MNNFSFESVRRKLILSVLLYLLVSFVIVALVAGLPLYQHHEEDIRKTFLALVDDRAHLLEDYGKHVFYLADQTSHKTGVRFTQQSLLREEISVEEFVAYLNPRFESIFKYDENISGVIKTLPDGSVVFSKGQSFPYDLKASEDCTTPHPHFHSPWYDNDGVPFLRVHVALFDSTDQDMGDDFYLISTKEISKHITITFPGDFLSGMRLWAALTVGKKAELLVSSYDNAPTPPICENISEFPSVIEKGGNAYFDCAGEGSGGCITAISAIPASSFLVVGEIDKSVLNAAAVKAFQPTTIAVFVLILGALGGLYVFFRPLTNKVFVAAEELSELNRRLEDEVYERSRAEEEARSLSGFYKAVIDQAAVGVGMAEADGRIVLINEKYAQILGYESPDALYTKSVEEISHPDDLELTRQNFKMILDGEASSLTYEKRFLRSDGSTVWANIYLSRAELSQGSSRLLCVMEDVTARKEADEKFHTVYNRMKEIIGFLPDSTMVVDDHGSVIHWNRAMETLTGRSEQESCGLSLSEISIHFYGKPHPLLLDSITTGAPPVESDYVDIKMIGDVYIGEKYLPAVYNGRGGWFRVKAAPFYDPSGRVAGAIESLRDITAEKRLRREEEDLRRRLEALWGIARLTDLDTKGLCDRLLCEATEMTKSQYGFFGFIDEEAQVMNLHAWSSEAMADCSVDEKYLVFPMSEAGIWADPVRYGTPLILNDFEAERPGKNGVPAGHVPIRRLMVVPCQLGGRTVAVTAVANKEAAYTTEDTDQLDLFVKSLMSILQKREFEDALLESERKNRRLSGEFSMILGAYPDYLARMRPDMTVIWGNEKAEMFVGKRCYEEWGLSTPCEGCPAPNAIRTGVSQAGRVEHPDGKTYDMRAYPIGDGGSQRDVIVFSSDVTQRVRDEKAEERAARLAALGELVAGVAHEINNPNGLILLNANLLNELLMAIDPALEDYCEIKGDFMVGKIPYKRMRDQIPRMSAEIVQSAQRIKAIVADLKNFSGIDRSKITDLVEINDVVKVATRLAGKTIEKLTSNFNITYGVEMPPCKGNFQRLEQVVINILVNACQSLTSREKGVFVSTGYDEKRGQVFFVARDEGKGISPEHISRVTDPFFTTRRDSGGTGLGLSVSSRIIREHGGEIDIDSTLGEGTCIRVFLPAYAG